MATKFQKKLARLERKYERAKSPIERARIMKSYKNALATMEK